MYVYVYMYMYMYVYVYVYVYVSVRLWFQLQWRQSAAYTSSRKQSVSTAPSAVPLHAEPEARKDMLWFRWGANQGGIYQTWPNKALAIYELF